MHADVARVFVAALYSTTASSSRSDGSRSRPATGGGGLASPLAPKAGGAGDTSARSRRSAEAGAHAAAATAAMQSRCMKLLELFVGAVGRCPVPTAAVPVSGGSAGGGLLGLGPSDAVRAAAPAAVFAAQPMDTAIRMDGGAAEEGARAKREAPEDQQIGDPGNAENAEAEVPRRGQSERRRRIEEQRPDGSSEQPATAASPVSSSTRRRVPTVVAAAAAAASPSSERGCGGADSNVSHARVRSSAATSASAGGVKVSRRSVAARRSVEAAREDETAAEIQDGCASEKIDGEAAVVVCSGGAQQRNKRLECHRQTEKAARGLDAKTEVKAEMSEAAIDEDGAPQLDAAPISRKRVRSTLSAPISNVKEAGAVILDNPAAAMVVDEDGRAPKEDSSAPGAGGGVENGGGEGDAKTNLSGLKKSNIANDSCGEFLMSTTARGGSNSR